MPFPKNIHLFCHVIDNLGDIGVCWRLARQLANDAAMSVTLWVDDLTCFHKICAAIAVDRDLQVVAGVLIKCWPENFPAIAPEAVGDVVIEAFACDLPASYIQAMAAQTRPPIWINLEYLSAESWVETCHTGTSRHALLALTKHFFFPGFSEKTGGLLREHNLFARRDAFQQDPRAIAHFLAEKGIAPTAQAAQKISLFCYPHAPVQSLFQVLQMGHAPTICLVPEHTASQPVQAFLQQPAHAGACATRGALTVQVLPWMDQDDYDRLLWACEINFVRGEDSFVRAQWAARPFVWHTYPQDKNAHWIKLDAFLSRYCTGLPDPWAQITHQTWHNWNGQQDEFDWRAYQTALPQLSKHACNWTQKLADNGDLASQLIQYISKIS